MNAYTIAVLFVICAMVGMVVAKVVFMAALAVLGLSVLGGAYVLYKIFSKDKT